LLPFGSPASHALFEYAETIGTQYRKNPQDNIITQLVQAEESGDRLSNVEYRNFFHVLVFAGNETTRTAITHGAMAFADFNQQWTRLMNDPALIDSAVEEVLRWATPVLHMRRTASIDTELAGTEITAGDKVVMWYAAATRDPGVFNDPFHFDVGRTENPHFAFGGGGPHFCLGAFLARMEIRILLQEMRVRALSLRQTEAPVRAPSNFVHGVLSVRLEPR
jgi:cholest-4-en-3-one 26-monooxygenase